MAATKDHVKNTWTVQFYYQTWTGERKKKFKRGFPTKKEALSWEREFLDKQQAQPDMLFSSLVELYLEDQKNRLKLSTMNTKASMVQNRIMPYFKNFRINEIKPSDVRKWQNELLAENYSQTYLKQLNNQLTAIINYAVKFYGLNDSPCLKAGTIGQSKAEEMLFWTKDEYFLFREKIKDRIISLIAFDILYFSGIRFGELVALTKEDLLTEIHSIDINKTLFRYEKKDYITNPKTKKSKRVLPIPSSLSNDLECFINQHYKIDQKDKLFNFTNKYLYGEMIRGCKLSGVKKIRIHDIRHSHASLLIELGYSPILIAERLGHEKIETTLNTYSHLYPSKQAELIDSLNNIFNGIESK